MKKKEIFILVTLIISVVTSIATLKYDSSIIKTIENKKVLCENKAESIDDIEIVYDGMTLNELAEKLDKSLNSAVEGKGYIFAKYSIEIGVDPYLAVAVMLHETGCKWNCSSYYFWCGCLFSISHYNEEYYFKKIFYWKSYCGNSRWKNIRA